MTKKILYSKYNSLRAPRYQLRTTILERDGERVVTKQPLNEKAAEHIRELKDNYVLLGSLYQNIRLLAYEDEGQGIRYPFLKGEHLHAQVDFATDDRETVIVKLRDALEKISDYRETAYMGFEETEEFRQMFPGCHPGECRALRPANLDPAFGNFIEVDGNPVCIDYEWAVDFPVPENYIRYRVLLYWYVENGEHLQQLFPGTEEFFACFGLTEDEVSCFSRMEDCFQQHIHGENWKYIYTNRYVKPTKSIGQLEQHIHSLDGVVAERNDEIGRKNQEILAQQGQISAQQGQISDLESRLADMTRGFVIVKGKLENIKKCIKNPIFGVKFTAKYLIKRANRRRYGSGTGSAMDYDHWIRQKEAGERYREKFAYNPKISVVVPVYNTEDRHLIPCIESVLNQVYKNWELVLSDDHSTWENVRATLQRYEKHPQVKVIYRTENGHISVNTNTAIEAATGDYIAFMDCDDLIRPNALYEVVKLLNEDQSLDFIYTDEDHIDDKGRHRMLPFFKPDWSPDTLMSIMYTCHLGVYRTSLVREIGGLRSECDGSQDYDFTLRFTEKTTHIGHVPKILYHWRERAESTAAHMETKPYVFEAAKKAKLDACERRGLKAGVEFLSDTAQFRVNYEPQGNPLVSIIIPSKDNVEVLTRCIRSIVERTEYRNYEILLVDNGSSEEHRQAIETLSRQYSFRYIYEPKEFNFSWMCNRGIAEASGEYYLFLNDDTEVITPFWLTRMLGQAQLPYAGAVGAKLLYPGNGLIQHCGVTLIEPGPVHAFGRMSDEAVCYFGRNKLTYNYLAVTGACLMVSVDKCREVGLWDESLTVAYNDIDLCLKLHEHGYYNVVRNDARLYHYESVSRGYDEMNEEKRSRQLREMRHLYENHPWARNGDPFYNANLTNAANDFSLGTVNTQEASRLKKTRAHYAESDHLIGSLDSVLRMNHRLIIAGWVLDSHSLNNSRTHVRILLVGKQGTYVAKTYHVQRDDVAGIHADYAFPEYSGFRAEANSEELPEGEYEVRVLCAGRVLPGACRVVE